MTPAERKVVFASSLGTLFEWYDFYLYGALAAILARHFFGGFEGGSGFVYALLAFAVGFVVRPFGALLFGRVGDMIGRKYTFLVTILAMGLATFLVGVLPTQAQIGVAAPVLLVALRLLQGLALGGEYGGAATYVAEHAPADRRGAYTAWVQTTATGGLLLSLVVIAGTRALLGDAAFEAWGWRVPFLVSIVLLAVSVWVRLSLQESPGFRRLKERGRASKAPLAEAFGRWGNLRVVLLALFGLVAGQAVVWYTGQFYALLFLTQTLKVDTATANVLVAAALVIGTPFFLIFGALSDRIGRKPIILAGCLAAALSYFPLFRALTVAANPDLAQAQARVAVVLSADPAECSLQFNPVGAARFVSSCDIARQALAERSVSYRTVDALGPAAIAVGSERIAGYSAANASREDVQAADAAFRQALDRALHGAGYPAAADPAKIDRLLVVAILALLVVYVAMVYGPLAAMLVELFPTRIRYSSLSLPYHIGNGWFGGALPPAAIAIAAHTGDVYAGLWYPVSVAAGTFVIGLVFLRETKGVDIYAKD